MGPDNCLIMPVDALGAGRAMAGTSSRHIPPGQSTETSCPLEDWAFGPDSRGGPVGAIRAALRTQLAAAASIGGHLAVTPGKSVQLPPPPQSPLFAGTLAMNVSV